MGKSVSLCPYFLCRQKKENAFSILYARIALGWERTHFTNYYFKSEHIVASASLMELNNDALYSLLENAIQGNIIDPNNNVSLNIEYRTPPSVFFSPVSPVRTHDNNSRIPALSIHGLQPFELGLSRPNIELIDWEIKASDSPYFGLDDILNSFLFPSYNNIQSSTLEIILMPPGRIDNESVLSNGKATIVIKTSPSLNIDKIRLGCIFFRQPLEITRTRIDPNSIVYEKSTDFLIGRVQLEAENVYVLPAFLSYGDICFHQLFLSDPAKSPNSRYSIYGIFDRDAAALKDIILSTDKSDMFEFFINNLLSLLGFNTLFLSGQKKLTDAPDIIAFTPQGNVAVVECTLGLPSANDKIQRVHKRAVNIRRELANIGLASIEVTPAIVSQLSRDEAKADIANAASYGILIICKEELENLLSRLKMPQNPDELLKEARNLIRQKEEE